MEGDYGSTLADTFTNLLSMISLFGVILGVLAVVTFVVALFVLVALRRFLVTGAARNEAETALSEAETLEVQQHLRPGPLRPYRPTFASPEAQRAAYSVPDPADGPR